MSKNRMTESTFHNINLLFLKTNVYYLCLSNSAVHAVSFTIWDTAVAYTNFVRWTRQLNESAVFAGPKVFRPRGYKSKKSQFSSWTDEDKFAPREIESGRERDTLRRGDEMTTRHTRLSYPLLCVPIYRVPIII